MIRIQIDNDCPVDDPVGSVMTDRDRILAFRSVRAQLAGKTLREEYALGELADEALSLLRDESGQWVVARCSDFRIKYIVAVFPRFEDASKFFVNALTEVPKIDWRGIFRRPLQEQAFQDPLQL